MKSKYKKYFLLQVGQDVIYMIYTYPQIFPICAIVNSHITLNITLYRNIVVGIPSHTYHSTNLYILVITNGTRSKSQHCKLIHLSPKIWAKEFGTTS